MVCLGFEMEKLLNTERESGRVVKLLKREHKSLIRVLQLLLF